MSEIEERVPKLSLSLVFTANSCHEAKYKTASLTLDLLYPLLVIVVGRVIARRVAIMFVLL